MMIADSFNALIVKNTVTSSKSVIIFRNVTFMLFQNIVIIITYSRIAFFQTAVLTIILSTQLNSLSTESIKNS